MFYKRAFLFLSAENYILASFVFKCLAMNNNRVILNADVAAAKLHRMALEVAEQLSGDTEPLILIGIRNKGSLIANEIAIVLADFITAPIQVITLQIDKDMPDAVALSEQVDFNNKNVILIDDVSNSGKTLLYALKPLLKFYPKRIQMLVLVERMHKLFPIKPDYVGYSIATASSDYVQVEEKNGNITAVLSSSI